MNTSNQYMFGLGDGWLNRKAAQIARKHGASLVNYTDPQCRCGYGCATGKCRASRRHWFVCQNRGNPFDQQTAEAVMTELGAMGITAR